ncbi:MAG: response regulator [Flavobacteriaceae bacterium]|nr:MAG: response regulator [Flavobacteriaceae bacterium]
MKEKIYVHVADDHKILIEGIIAVINTDDNIEVEGYSLTGREVIDWSKEKKADILILDINMPVFDGIDVLKFFQTNEIEQKVIILSSYDDVDLVKQLLHLGVKGFLSKNSAGEHIIKAIKVVAKGGQYFSDDIKNNLFKSYTGQKVKEGDRPESTIAYNLTERELEVLKLIAKQNSTAEISDILHISTNTVETYRKNLFKKTKVKNAVGLAMYAVKNNII